MRKGERERGRTVSWAFTKRGGSMYIANTGCLSQDLLPYIIARRCFH